MAVAITDIREVIEVVFEVTDLRLACETLELRFHARPIGLRAE